MGIARQKNSDAVVFWGTCLVYLFFTLFLITAYTPFHILPLRIATARVAKTFYPARWNVYAQSPADPVYQIYRIEQGRAVLYDLRPFVPSYYFGLKRNYKVMASERMVITDDTVGLSKMNKYSIQLKKTADINAYLNTDTLKFNEVASDNVLYLRGKYLITIAPHKTWQHARVDTTNIDSEKVIPVNIIPKQ